MAARILRVRHAPADVWHDEPVESWEHLTDDVEKPGRTPAATEPPSSWRSILDLLAEAPAPDPKPTVEPEAYPRNGFHVDNGQQFQRPGQAVPRSARHQVADEDKPEQRQFWFESNGRHSRNDPDDASRYGRHSTPWRD
jgi:hypothetical protein